MSVQSSLSFVAIDVETANANMASICQIGIVEYQNGSLVSEWKSYVDPEDYFDGMNVSIHGITEKTVVGAPTFSAIAETLRSMLDGKVTVCHTHFDRVAIGQAFRKNNAVELSCRWLDSAKVVRRAWEECAAQGYGLSAVSKRLGYKFQHHDALEDAKASAHILIRACEERGLDVEGWLSRVGRPIVPNSGGSVASIRREGNPEGELAGEVLVFTGALGISRQEAANIAASIGCQVGPSVTKKTTMLVVGDQDISKLVGHEKSSKHRKAEELIAAGAPMRIIGESDFMELVKQSRAYA
ncbi:exonuclease domain-containing protein [Stutzerimonas stutzeri]|uniref:exonuclease domain-containing protein n=1 Tax=Stutzerimonas stutzeri TaxID=316 RepID=UPI00210B550B|nr:exonuclease domain-containing protein [Stutzerimonas stutzeri]MCQ4323156.1 exonuclease domain-containing protein [Stutzerimonas stutzeri]